MTHTAKMTITLSMLWIGTLALVSTPEWLRAARDFVSRSSGHAGGATAGAGGGDGSQLVP